MILNYRRGTHYTKLTAQSDIQAFSHMHTTTAHLSNHTDICLLILNTRLLVRVKEKIKFLTCLSLTCKDNNKVVNPY